MEIKVIKGKAKAKEKVSPTKEKERTKVTLIKREERKESRTLRKARPLKEVKVRSLKCHQQAMTHGNLTWNSGVWTPPEIISYLGEWDTAWSADTWSQTEWKEGWSFICEVTEEDSYYQQQLEKKKEIPSLVDLTKGPDSQP